MLRNALDKVTFVLDADVSEADEMVATLEAGTDTMQGGDRTVTVAGLLAMNRAVLASLTDGILRTMVIALVAIFVTMVGVFRLTHGSGSLGAVVAVPIAMVIGLVIGGMYLLDIPLTLLTALLMSLVIGLGIDYNIHVSDRFAQELDGGLDPVDALYETVTGTGGALLGSALTSSAAFATLLVHPSPVFQSFGFIVVVALLLSFAVSVLVFPSLLLWWARRVGVEDPSPESHPGGPRESAGRSRRT